MAKHRYVFDMNVFLRAFTAVAVTVPRKSLSVEAALARANAPVRKMGKSL